MKQYYEEQRQLKSYRDDVSAQDEEYRRLKDPIQKVKFRQDRLRKQLNARRLLSQEAKVLMVNPLEISIKKNQVQAATLLVKEFGINPIACFSSDYSKSLLELAACYSFETFNGLIETLDAKDLKDVQLLKTLMKIL